jgi:DNA-binding beta-propeller fold protein YncE
VLDPESLDVIQTIWGRHQPTGLAVSPDGRYLATTDFLDDNLAVYRVAD